jgi:hypothetical protein
VHPRVGWIEIVRGDPSRPPFIVDGVKKMALYLVVAAKIESELCI